MAGRETVELLRPPKTQRQEDLRIQHFAIETEEICEGRCQEDAETRYFLSNVRLLSILICIDCGDLNVLAEICCAGRERKVFYKALATPSPEPSKLPVWMLRASCAPFSSLMLERAL